MDFEGLELKGIVSCPECKKEVAFVYSDAKGHTSVPCVRCGKIMLIDIGRLEAKLVVPLKRQKQYKLNTV